MSLIFSNLVVIKTLSSNHRMYNLYAKFVKMVEPIRTLQSYVCGFEQVKLYVSSNIPFVTIDATVVISMFYILHIMEVSHTCL